MAAGFHGEIERAIQDAEVVRVLVPKTPQTRPGLLSELELTEELGKKLIPIRFGPGAINLPGRLGDSL